MRRLLLFAGITSILLVPASALGATVNYRGTVMPRGAVGFDATVKQGVVKKIKGSAGPPPTGMIFERVPVHCDQGNLRLTILLNHNIAVTDRRFHVVDSIADFDGKVEVGGRFARHLNKVAGTYRLSGDFGASATNCESGTLSWTADAT